MKLLVDELFSPVIAGRLRAAGHDAVAVADEPSLRGLSDAEIFARAQEMRRAVVTENVADYLRLDADHRARGEPHLGLVLTSNRAFPRGRSATIGALVSALDALLREHSDEEASSAVRWLQSTP